MATVIAQEGNNGQGNGYGDNDIKMLGYDTVFGSSDPNYQARNLYYLQQQSSAGGAVKASEVRRCRSSAARSGDLDLSRSGVQKPHRSCFWLIQDGILTAAHRIISSIYVFVNRFSFLHVHLLLEITVWGRTVLIPVSGLRLYNI
ncbi:hypothetical protein Vadar_027498 [Vaccinium darrowii]|uniref:Uncharacterized protein n=1 Tax=Vaccinium darrowii TaxID=229202 RepID=A0ACB7ZLR6_9ERIC|nr:hypothetical protein Vadar_027498 [Vaccinium darrowii]